MGIIFIIGSIQALIFFLLLTSKKQKIFSIKALSFLFVIIALHLFIRYIYSIGILYDYPHLLGIHVGFALLYGPILFFYVDSLTRNKQTFQKFYWLHFIPFFVVIITLIPFFMESAEYKLRIINGIETYPSKYAFIIMMQLASGPVYAVWLLILLKRHKKNIKFQYSYTEKIELKWLKNLTIGLSSIWLVILIVYAIWDLFDFQISFERELIIYSAVTVFVFVIGYKGLKQGPIFIANLSSDSMRDLEFNEIDFKAEENQNSLVDQSKKESYSELVINKNEEANNKFGLEFLEEQSIDKLLNYMENQKPYLEDKLMLSDVALAIGIPHFKLTKIFNDNLQTNFFNFINAYRVDQVKKMLSDRTNDQFTILALAYDCGFSSKASFNRIFKQMTKMTPSEYQKGCRANRVA